MNTRGFVRLIFLKDVRRSMWLLGMVLGLGLTVALILLFGTGTGAAFLVFLPALFAYLIGLFLTMDLIQIDWPGRDLRFLFTRPVPGEAIFFAKILFLGLFLILSGWGFQELDYAVLGMPLQPLDHLCLLIETTIHLGTAMALLVLFALFLRKNQHVFLALGFLFVAIGFLSYFGMIFPGIAAVAPARNHAQLCWGALVGLLGQWGFIGVVLLAALVRYRTHKFGLPLALVIGGIILDLLLCVGIDKIGESRLAHDDTSRMPPHLSVRVEPVDISPAQTEQTAWNVSIIYHTVVRGANVEGVDAPYYFQVVGTQSTATLRSGKIIRSVVEQTPVAPAPDIGGLMGVPFEAAVIGVNAGVPGVSYGKPGITLRAFTYLPSRLPSGEDLTGVTINAEVQLEIHRAYVAGSIPLEPGAVFTRPRQRYEITGVSGSRGGEAPRGVSLNDVTQQVAHGGFVGGLIHSGADTSGGVLLNLTYTKLPLILRGDTGANPDNLSWALVSRPRNEILQVFSGSSNTPNFPVDFATSSMLYSNPGNNAVPPDWIKGAELVFLGNETCGQVTVPYEIKNVTLTR
jgi:hypothetical protein